MALGLWLGSGVRVRFMARERVSVRYRIVFRSILHNFAQFYAFRIVQMRNGYGGKTRG